MKIEKIILASPRGFCGGVKRAIEIVEKALEIHGKPIYIKHQIVHNNHITKRLKEKGAITVENMDEIPCQSKVIFSAHGSEVNDFQDAKKKNLTVIDSICPLVKKVHIEAKKFAKENYKIIYIGKKKHKEAKGVLSQAPQNIIIIENETDLENTNLNQNQKIACLTQTTLNYDETSKLIEKIKQKYPQTVLPPKDDICFSTTNRQNAIKEVAKQSDLVLVVGSESSSNSNRLVEVAKEHTKQAYLIDDISKIKEEWFKDENIKTLGLSCGASVPEDLVQEIIKFFKDKGSSIEELKFTEEKMSFPLPKEVFKK